MTNNKTCSPVIYLNKYVIHEVQKVAGISRRKCISRLRLNTTLIVINMHYYRFLLNKKQTIYDWNTFLIKSILKYYNINCRIVLDYRRMNGLNYNNGFFLDQII